MPFQHKACWVTSQIALFNSLGVAIASDTVTTHTQGSSVKTTNNSEKIWLVGPDHLVAVVVSGSVVVNGSNVRNFVTEWSRTLDGPLETIAEYPESFSRWLQANTHLASNESQLYRVQSAVHDHYSFMARRLRYLLNPENGENEPTEVWASVLGEAQEYLQGLPLFDGATDQEDAALLAVEDVGFEKLVSDLLSSFDLYEQHQPAVLQQAPLVLSRVQGMPGDAELGFVGFGATDHHAKSVRVNLRGCYGDRWRLAIDKPFGSDGSGFSGSIAFFAQADAIQGFLRGSHFALVDRAVDYVWDAVYNMIEGDDDVDLADQVASGLRSELQRHQSELFVNPMLDTIGGLPLTNLASLAESLVGIQATRSAAEAGPATVGGFIETLLISRAHGLQWVNRLPGLPT